MNRYPNTDDKIIVKKIAALSGYFFMATSQYLLSWCS